MKAIEQYFPVVLCILMLYKVFESEDLAGNPNV